MLAKVFSGTTIGLEGVLIDVEVDVANRGFPTFTIVGLPGKAVDEAKDRVRSAITHASFEMPDSRMTVNLAPADIPKVGSSFDLPIAVGILAATGLIDRTTLSKKLFVGELSLEGQVRKIPGIISIALLAKEQGIEELFVPFGASDEAALIEGITIYPVKTLTDLILHLNGQQLIAEKPPIDLETLSEKSEWPVNFSDIRGQAQAKRALEIAAAGFHNVHLTGPPGTGKTLLSRAFASIVPRMEREEVLEVSKIYSVAGLLQKKNFILERPFRSPHHTTSRIGLIGGGSIPAPGEISLAHRGVLFLDEFPEFTHTTLESLRQPIEDGMVTISRASGSLTFPSRFILLAASNPCPCGYFGHPQKTCHCLPGMINRYRKKISGPILDRIDLHVTVPVVEEEKLISFTPGESSEHIAGRVMAAKNIQRERFKNTKVKTNGEMTPVDIREFCHFSSESLEFLKDALRKLSLSARAYFKVVKVSQTIADLSGVKEIGLAEVAEALQYRRTEE